MPKGGKREGAGRPFSLETTQTFGIRLPISTIEGLKKVPLDKIKKVLADLAGKQD